MFLISVTPVPAQFDLAAMAGMGVVLTFMLAIAIVLQVVTSARSDHDAKPTATPKRLGHHRPT